MAVQKVAKRILAKYRDQYAELGDSFLENLQTLATRKIYQADAARYRAMNTEAERFRRVTMAVLSMRLNSIIVMDIVALGGLVAVYAEARVAHCPHMEAKTFCSQCPTHCYAAKQREAIRNMMRYSGPRMLLHHPLLTITHGVDTLRVRRAK